MTEDGTSDIASMSINELKPARKVRKTNDGAPDVKEQAKKQRSTRNKSKPVSVSEDVNDG